uniref:Uncharacterized protein n=1 Tax=Rhizophora mucronata TaxID=61149 RepID=A0A2P2IIC2_RHIMU
MMTLFSSLISTQSCQPEPRPGQSNCQLAVIKDLSPISFIEISDSNHQAV